MKIGATVYVVVPRRSPGQPVRWHVEERRVVSADEDCACLFGEAALRLSFWTLDEVFSVRELAEQVAHRRSQEAAA